MPEKLSARLARRFGAIDLWRGHPALERPIACILDTLPACLSARLPVRTIGHRLRAAQARGHKARSQPGRYFAAFDDHSASVTRPSSLPGNPFPSDIRALLGAPSWRSRKPWQSPRFQGARPVWSRAKRRPDGRGAGMQSAGLPPTPDAMLSPHRLSGFRRRAPLRRSGNRPVRTVGRNGGVWYMMRDDCKTHVMMQCHAHA
jgi:hypothetical protein